MIDPEEYPEEYSYKYMMTFVLLFIDCCTLLIYLDLYMITRFHKRIFTILFEKQIIAKKQIKPYANAYYASLKRDWFCILDKVQVDGLMGCERLIDLLMF